MAEGLPPEVKEGRDGERQVFKLLNALRRTAGVIVGDAAFWLSTASGTLTGAVDIGSLPAPGGLLKVDIVGGYATPSIAVVNTDFPSVNAFYVVTQATNAPPNAVNLGALATGVLQQTVTLGVSTPQATPLTPQWLLFGGTDSLVAQSTYLAFDPVNIRLGVGTPTPDPQSLVTFLRNQNAAVNLFLSNANAGAGAAASLILQAAATDVLGDGPYLAIGTYGRNLVAPGPDPYFSAGSTVISAFTDDGLTFDLASITGGGAAPTWRWVTHDIAIPPYAQIFRMELDYDGHLAIADLAAGGIVWADPGTATAGRLSLVTIAGSLTFNPATGTLTGTGGGGTVTAVTASDGLSSSGGTTPNITHDDSALAPGTHGSAGIASFDTDINGHVTAVTTASYVATTRTLAATAPVRIDGGAGPLDLSANRTFSLNTDVTFGVLGGQLTMIPFTASGPGSLKGAVPDPGAVAGTTRYLREDATWVAPPFQPTGNYITALTGDGTATGPGSVPFTLATVNSNVGTFTFATVTVNAKGLITAASSGSTAGFQPTITWPTAGQVLFSSGTSTDPIGVAGVTIDTQQFRIVGTSASQAWFNLLSGSDYERVIAYWTGDVWTLEQQAGGTGTVRAMRISSGLGLNSDPDVISPAYLLTVASTASRDRVWWGLGGLTISDGVNREWMSIAPTSTTVDTNNISLLATVRIRATDYTLTGVSAGLIAGLYIDQPTFNGGSIGSGGTSAYGIYAGGGTGTQSKFEGIVISNAIATGKGEFAGDGTHVWKVPIDNTGNTSGAVGRIAIDIGGATRYVRYFND